MTDSKGPSSEASRKAQFEALLKTVSELFNAASEEEQLRLLSWQDQMVRPDRRRHPRMLTLLPVSVDDLHSGTATNISPEGLCIRTSASFAGGQEISLVFPSFGQKEAVTMAGRVIWTSKLGVGVKFTSPLAGELKEMMEGS